MFNPPQSACLGEPFGRQRIGYSGPLQRRISPGGHRPHTPRKHPLRHAAVEIATLELLLDPGLDGEIPVSVSMRGSVSWRQIAGALTIAEIPICLFDVISDATPAPGKAVS